MSQLQLEDVRVTYGRGRSAVEVVRGVSLAVDPGTVLGLVGESGSGKSTLVRAAVGLVPLSGGRILFDGTPLDLRMSRAATRPFSMVFQDPYSSLNPRMRIGETIIETLAHGRASTRASREEEVARLLDLVGLEHVGPNALPAELSGGQRQRVALARALAGRPKVLIADEVTSALDVSVQGNVLNLLRELQAELGFSLVFISHNLAVVRYMSDTIAVMNKGRIVEEGPAQAIIDSPEHVYTAQLLEAVPRRMEGRVRPVGSAVSQPDTEEEVDT